MKRQLPPRLLKLQRQKQIQRHSEKRPRNLPPRILREQARLREQQAILKEQAKRMTYDNAYRAPQLHRCQAAFEPLHSRSDYIQQQIVWNQQHNRHLLNYIHPWNQQIMIQCLPNYIWREETEIPSQARVQSFESSLPMEETESPNSPQSGENTTTSNIDYSRLLSFLEKNSDDGVYRLWPKESPAQKTYMQLEPGSIFSYEIGKI